MLAQESPVTSKRINGESVNKKVYPLHEWERAVGISSHQQQHILNIRPALWSAGLLPLECKSSADCTNNNVAVIAIIIGSSYPNYSGGNGDVIG